jgi:hypothetical protein
MGSDHGRVHRQQLLKVRVEALLEQSRDPHFVEDPLVGAVL